MKKLFISIGILTLSSCTFFINNATNDKYDVINIGEKKSLKIMFSHNINGETHPCGCRQNPLGGLPQVAGAFHEAAKDADLLYVDTGDTFFPSEKFPDTVKKSLNHTAQTLVKGLRDLELKYFVPGDQDFAGGMQFLNELNQKNYFTFLISNLSKESQWKHKKFGIIKKGPHEIYMMGIVDPDVINRAYRSQFINPLEGIQKVFEDVKKAGYSPENKFHRLILLSHAGAAVDSQLAKKFPHFDWIIGAHSQSFTRFPIKEGKTAPVQVLSRNHYIGQITIDFTKDRSGDKFEILEMRDEQKDKLNPNPFLAFIDAHKEALKKIQEEEQSNLSSETFSEKQIPINTASSCVECHTEQGEFWNQTSHSIAYGTLMIANEEKNLNCIQCHSYGLNMKNGFSTQEGLVHIDKEAYVQQDLDGILEDGAIEKRKSDREKKLAQIKATYWSEVKNIFKDVKSIRALDNNKRSQLAASWQELDQKHKVTHNYANVQCLNCHDQHVDHPFTNLPEVAAEKKYGNMKSKCLTCHVSDQSPKWYNPDGKINETLLAEKMKSVACPKVQEQ